MCLHHQLINLPPKLSDIQIAVGNYEGEGLRYNTMEGIKKVKEVSMNMAEKEFELVIPFLEEWKDMNPGSTIELHVDDRKHI